MRWFLAALLTIVVGCSREPDFTVRSFVAEARKLKSLSEIKKKFGAPTYIADDAIPELIFYKCSDGDAYVRVDKDERVTKVGNFEDLD